MSNVKRPLKKWKRFWEIRRHAPKRDCIEVVDLLKTAQTIRLIEPFVRVKRVIYSVLQDTAIKLSDLGKLTVTNGFDILYDSKPINPLPLNSSFRLIALDYDFDTFSDGAVTKLYTLVSRFSFDKFVPEGLDMKNDHKLEVVIKDDLTTMGSQAYLTFEGWKWGEA